MDSKEMKLMEKKGNQVIACVCSTIDIDTRLWRKNRNDKLIDTWLVSVVADTWNLSFDEEGLAEEMGVPQMGN